jgi:hypothetical protein
MSTGVDVDGTGGRRCDRKLLRSFRVNIFSSLYFVCCWHNSSAPERMRLKRTQNVSIRDKPVEVSPFTTHWNLSICFQQTTRNKRKKKKMTQMSHENWKPPPSMEGNKIFLIYDLTALDGPLDIYGFILYLYSSRVIN